MCVCSPILNSEAMNSVKQYFIIIFFHGVVENIHFINEKHESKFIK